MNKQKVIVVGTNHAGTSLIRTLAKINPEAEIVTYDQNNVISFLGCGIALWVSGEFEDPAGLFYSSPKQLTSMGAKVRMEHRVTNVDVVKKSLTVMDLKTCRVFEDKYDKLVYAAGTWPIVPPLPGIDLKGVCLAKLFQHAQHIRRKMNDPSVKNVVVVGAGYIGVELAEGFAKNGKSVTLIDMEKRLVPRYFDQEFTSVMEERARKAGLRIQLGEKVSKFNGKNGRVTSVATTHGVYPADLVILSVGVIPQTRLLQNKVKTAQNGAVVVDKYQVTSNPDIYAIGDACTLYHTAFKKEANVALATNAIKSGVVAAFHITSLRKGHAVKLPFPGIQGTNAISVFGCNYASTGLSEETLKAFKISYGAEFLVDSDRPEFMKHHPKVQIKITYDPQTHLLLGAQIGSFGDTNHTEAIYALSLAINQGYTLTQLLLSDFFFLPHFNKPINYVMQVILNALKLRFPTLKGA